MSTKVAQSTLRHVKPILSLDRAEAKRRVLNLYKAWYRQIPHSLKLYHVPITVKQGRDKLREEFLKNKHVTDVRAIDVLVIKGQMELVELMKRHKQDCHIMNYFKDTQNQRPSDFLGKFFDGHE